MVLHSVFKPFFFSPTMSESLENADTALTIVPAGVAAAGAIGSRVAPKSVKRSISAGRSWLQRNYDAFKHTHPKLFFIVNTYFKAI